MLDKRQRVGGGPSKLTAHTMMQAAIHHRGGPRSTARERTPNRDVLAGLATSLRLRQVRSGKLDG